MPIPEHEKAVAYSCDLLWGAKKEKAAALRRQGILDGADFLDRVEIGGSPNLPCTASSSRRMSNGNGNNVNATAVNSRVPDWSFEDNMSYTFVGLVAMSQT
ncbi:hypothetical protein UCRPA7_4984 [Phaeoacremonium minimum UCRPA7]|uniref:Uncharacterized protein n=1 Tax=Phaeoacremonium minimum (strain UCR-PA7) TaxID=1286976 RepID=R8BJJ6_PHAM7|nr:hypothetical protein UCRPA7_4984 [Phaeoacremonium minimum UCRPA7]EON99486.1 hypothetical protein UCRPA7_4984 [Phaeoacremonium minimum UCRPA7]